MSLRTRIAHRILPAGKALVSAVRAAQSLAPVADIDRNLDPQVRALIAASSILPGTHTMDPEAARRSVRMQAFAADVPKLELGAVEDIEIRGAEGPLRARKYVPRHQRGGRALVYYHGGGWVICDLDTHDGLCRWLCERAGVTVVSVDYRLAPEHPYPAAALDAIASFGSAAEVLRAELGADAQIAVAGDSAGGNLSANVSIAALRGEVEAPAFQLLIYPGLDMTRSLPSHQTFGSGYYLDSDMMDWFLDHYVPPRQRKEAMASPLLGAQAMDASELGRLCPTIVVTAGYDALIDEGHAFAQLVESTGVPVRYRCETRLPHAYAQMGGLIDEARRALDRFVNDLDYGYSTWGQ